MLEDFDQWFTAETASAQSFERWSDGLFCASCAWELWFCRPVQQVVELGPAPYNRLVDRTKQPDRQA